MASSALNKGSWRPPVAPAAGAAQRGLGYIVQQQQQHQEQEQQQMKQQHQLQPQYRVRTAAEDDANTRISDAEAKIEVTAQCRSRDEVFQALKEAIQLHPVLSRKHRELLANTVKAMIADCRSSYYMISGAHAALQAAGPAWQGARERGAAVAACRAAAAAAAGLTMAGMSPKEAAETAADTAASKGVGATRNLVPRYKLQQQRRHSAAAAAAALHRAQAAAAAAADDDSSSVDPEGDPCKPLPHRSSSSSSNMDSSSNDNDSSNSNDNNNSSNSSSSSTTTTSIAPDSAAAVSQGMPIPEHLLDTILSDVVLPFSEYFCKRLDAFLRQLINEVRSLANKIHNIVNRSLMPAADSTEARVFYLQLNADVSRYASQVVTDADECQQLRKQSLGFYRSALELLNENEKDKNKEKQKKNSCHTNEEETQEVPLSVKMGLVLNYAVLLHDEPNGVQPAIAALAAQFREAVENVVHITDAEESRRVMMVLSLLRGNVEAWCLETGRDDSASLLGLDDSSGLL